MSKLLPILLILILITVGVTGLSACGSHAKTRMSADVVAVVGTAPITRANLDHWMRTIVGGDFFERIKRRAPLGLVSEPPNYAACISASEILVAESKQGKPFTKRELDAKCAQLYQGVKEQAMTFLVSVQWRINEAAENGLKLSDAEVSQYAREANARDFPKPGEFAKYLADREWAPADQLYQFRRNLLTTRLREKINSADTPQAERQFVHFIGANIKKRTAETSCRSSYIVFQCRQFRTTPSTIGPIVVLEELVLGKRLPH